MATKKKRKQDPRTRTRAAEKAEPRAPERRGGTAMGRTVGLPFGGARPRKRKNPSAKGGRES